MNHGTLAQNERQHNGRQIRDGWRVNYDLTIRLVFEGCDIPLTILKKVDFVHKYA